MTIANLFILTPSYFYQLKLCVKYLSIILITIGWRHLQKLMWSHHHWSHESPSHY